MQYVVRRGSDWVGALLSLPMPPAFGQDAALSESDPVFPALFRPDANQHLAGCLKAVRSLELAQLLCNFGPSPFTIRVIQSAHEFSQITGRISHISHSVSGGRETSRYRHRMHRHVQKTGPSVDVCKRPWLSECVHPRLSRRWRRYLADAADHAIENPFYVAAIVKPLFPFFPSLASFLEEVCHIALIILYTRILVLTRTGMTMRVSTSQSRDDPYPPP